MISLIGSLALYGITQEDNNGVKLLVKEIQAEYHGELLEEFNPRKNIPPLFLRVKASKYSFYDFSVSEEVINFADVGDTILKKKNDNIIYVYNREKRGKFTYKNISQDSRENKYFPLEWKNKWIDTINQTN